MDFHAHVLLGKPVIEGKKVVIFGRGEQPRNFVAASDVAQFAVRALKEDSLAGQTIDIGGPQNLSNLDVVRTYESSLSADREGATSSRERTAPAVTHHSAAAFGPGSNAATGGTGGDG